MQEFSKYRVITAGIVLMFIFVIAAIYTNTKEVATKKMNAQKNEISQNQPKIEQGTQIETPPDFATQKNSDSGIQANNEIANITERVTQLEQKVYTQGDNGIESVSCSVKGIIDNGHMVPLSPQEAINESRTNDKEVIITCFFK
ncbi:hypothetical protein J6I39_07780 [bacterium]|nr:hypothetical protein [bacterium]